MRDAKLTLSGTFFSVWLPGSLGYASRLSKLLNLTDVSQTERLSKGLTLGILSLTENIVISLQGLTICDVQQSLL